MSYLGCKISLTSKSAIRYEGILKAVDAVASTVTLSEVRVYGTEGRRPGSEVPEGREVYAEVTFNSTDIQDLSVYESLPNDPAIVSSSTSSVPAYTSTPSSSVAAASSSKAYQSHSSNQNDRTPAGQINEDVALSTPSAPRKQPFQTAASAAALKQPSFAPSNSTVREQTTMPKVAPTFSPSSSASVAPAPSSAQRSWASVVGNNASSQSQTASQSTNRYMNVSAAASSSSRPRPYNIQQPAVRPVVIPSTDFDFEGSNARFDGDGLREKLATGESVIYYSKAKSFFDLISTELSSPASASTANGRSGAEDRRVNMETFGQISLHPPHTTGQHYHHHHHQSQQHYGNGNRNLRYQQPPSRSSPYYQHQNSRFGTTTSSSSSSSRPTSAIQTGSAGRVFTTAASASRQTQV